MKKSELKSIIKECLIEILSEGIGSNLNESLQMKKRTTQQTQKLNEVHRNVKDLISYSNLQKKPTMQKINHKELSDDPIISSIFEETASRLNTQVLEESALQKNINPDYINGGVDLKVFSNLTSDTNLIKKWDAMTFDKKIDN